MSRIEENEYMCNSLWNFRKGPYTHADIEFAQLQLLEDISKSLAVIADCQAANRPHGKWDTEFINDGFVGCPFCRTTHDIDGDIHLNDLHYCVNCGAKLD